MKKPAILVTLTLGMLYTAAASSQSIVDTNSIKMVLIAIISPFTASVVIAAFYRYLKDYSAYIGGFSALISLTAVWKLIGSTGKLYYNWIPSLGIGFEFYIDGLSILIASLASGIGILILLYSRAYMSHGERKRKYYATLTAFMGSMIGLVFSSNMILLFLFWEFTSICSFLLISHSQRTDSAIYASKKSLLITVGSGMMLLTGLLILGDVFGTYSIAELLQKGNVAKTLVEQGLYLPVLALIGVGAFAKSAQVPLHIWLPDAMEAPTPVSAFLHSATMVKAGIFLLARFRPMLVGEEVWQILLVAVGMLTMVIAALLAVKSTELKELLAYSTASHLGLIVAGLGFSSVLGAETGVFHILNHAVFKAALFMVAGVILHETGTQKIADFTGLRHNWPVLAGIGTIAGLSMAGVPPLNGFYSKELLFEASYYFASENGGLAWLAPITAVLGSVFTFVYSIRFISVFYGEKQREREKIPRLMKYSPGVLAFLAVIIGLFPNSFIDLLVEPAVNSVAISSHGFSVHLPVSIKPAVLMSGITLLIGFFTYIKRQSIIRSTERLVEIPYFRSNYYYHSALNLSDIISDKAAEVTETGLLRTYAIWTLSVAAFLGLTGYAVSGSIPEISITATLPLAIVLATAVASVYAVIRDNTYIASVLTLSILGFMVAIYYLILDAPDLVMTQLVVETLSLIIFLLVLDKLPEFREKISIHRKLRDMLTASFAGLLIFASVLYSRMAATPGEVANYYLENALPGSGGTNVVNVILVDFRGIDTMGEISVIAMAGLAIMMLFKMRGEKQ
ncbi:MAG: multicomponent Na+:H+ antiporter subunit A [Candidatus Nanohaloarchaea archaeon]|jgi:multicomponent Na+:H+ antiporter subunit A